MEVNDEHEASSTQVEVLPKAAEFPMGVSFSNQVYSADKVSIDNSAEDMLAISPTQMLVEGTKVPPRSVVMGIPGRVVRAATVDEVARTRAINARYLELARRYAEGRIDQPYEG
jgi:hypothetical protein